MPPDPGPDGQLGGHDRQLGGPDRQLGDPDRQPGGSTAEERLERALKAAWAHLGRRDRTVAEVRRHLEARVIDAASADGAIAVLIEQGYLDDQRFARAFVTDKRELEHWGAERISRGLLARGVPAPLVEAALAAEPGTPVDADGASHPPELRRALDLLARRHPHPFLDDRDRHRALAMLLRKGYESEVAYDAIRLHAVERRRTVGAASGG